MTTEPLATDQDIDDLEQFAMSVPEHEPIDGDGPATGATLRRVIARARRAVVVGRLK